MKARGGHLIFAIVCLGCSFLLFPVYFAVTFLDSLITAEGGDFAGMVGGDPARDSKPVKEEHHEDAKAEDYTMPGPPDDFLVAVCVVGQLSRLQVDALVEHFIEPNRHKHGHTVDVVVRLYNSEDATNETDLIPGVWAKSTTGQIELHLGQYARYVSVSVEDPPDIKIRDTFVDAMDKAYRSLEAKRKRHLGHLRQYYAVGACMDQVEAWEDQEGERYDVILKLREDSELQADLIVKPEHTKAAFFLKCMSWGGLDDRSFIGGRESAGLLMRNLLPDYSSQPEERWLMEWKEEKRLPRNIEQTYRREAEMLGISVRRVSIDSLPFLTVRIKSDANCYKATPDCVPCAYFRKFESLDAAIGGLCPPWRAEANHSGHWKKWCKCNHREDEM
ncbi:unnamed protein product [Chrysoparadoxa australica]